MKKNLCTMLIVTVLMSVMCVSAFAQMPIGLIVGGERVESDVDPVIVNGRTLVPLRVIFEALDATVEWDNATRTVNAKKDDKVISITIGEDVMKVNSEMVKLDVPAQIVEGRTMIPVRAVSEALDCKVDWNNDSRTVRVKTDMWKPSAIEFCKVYYHGDEKVVSYQWEEYTYDENSVQMVVYTGEEKEKHWIQKTVYDADANEIKVVNIDPETKAENVVREVTYENGLLADDKVFRYSYDDDGRLLKKESYDGNFYTEYTYDKNGNLVKEKNSIPNSNGTETWYEVDKIEYTRDNNGNVINKKFLDQYTVGINKVETRESNTAYTYDSKGNLISENYENGYIEYSYDDAGNLVAYDTEHGYVEFEYWGDTRVKYSCDNGVDTGYYTIENEYLNPTNVSYEEDYINYSLDEEGRLVEIEYDNEEDWAFSKKITYDKNGNVILVEGSDGGYTKYEYTSVKW